MTRTRWILVALALVVVWFVMTKKAKASDVANKNLKVSVTVGDPIIFRRVKDAPLPYPK